MQGLLERRLRVDVTRLQSAMHGERQPALEGADRAPVPTPGAQQLADAVQGIEVDRGIVEVDRRLRPRLARRFAAATARRSTPHAHTRSPRWAPATRCGRV